MRRIDSNITPAGQVQDGNNNCLSYTRNAQSLISAQTVRNRLREAGQRACRPVVRQVLTRHHRQQRHLWAQTHRRWTRQVWRKVLFTDESRFCLTRGDGRIVFIIEGMSVTPRPVLWNGINLEVKGPSWSGEVCHSIIGLSLLSLQAISTLCITGKTSSSCGTLPAGLS